MYTVGEREGGGGRGEMCMDLVHGTPALGVISINNFTILDIFSCNAI